MGDKTKMGSQRSIYRFKVQRSGFELEIGVKEFSPGSRHVSHETCERENKR